MSREYPGESRLCGAEEGEEAEGRGWGSVAEEEAVGSVGRSIFFCSLCHTINQQQHGKQNALEYINKRKQRCAWRKCLNRVLRFKIDRWPFVITAY